MQEDGQDNNRILYLFGDNSKKLEDVFKNLDQDVWDQIAELSGLRSSAKEEERPYFSDLTDELLERTSKISKEERGDYIKKAYEFWEFVEIYDDPFFARNFFGYLFDKTEGMNNHLKRASVLEAKFVYDSVFFVLHEKMEDKASPESLIGLVRPKSDLKENLNFDDNDYESLKNELVVRKRINPKDNNIYLKKTVSDVIDLVSGKN